MVRKFNKEFMQAIAWNEQDDDVQIIQNEIDGHSRWEIYYRVVFKYEEKFYASVYSMGATEQQDSQPYEYDDEIECQEVFPIKKEITVYE